MNAGELQGRRRFLAWLITLVQFAESNRPGSVLVSALRPHIARMERAKNNHKVGPDGKPMRGNATLIMQVPDEAYLDLKKDDEAGDLWVLVRVRRKMIERFESPVLMPGEKAR